MKRNLIWGWVFAVLAVMMLCFTFYGFYIGNDFGAMMCCIAAGINICNATARFAEYKRQRDLLDAAWKKLNEVRNKVRCPDKDKSDTAGILSSGSFIDD